MNRPERWPPIFFRCDAGTDHGLGHLMRCLTLADALLFAGAEPPTFITSAADSIGAQLVTSRGFPSALSPSAAGLSPDMRMLFRAIAKTNTRPILVIDNKYVQSAYSMAFRDTACVVCIDDEQGRDLPCDILINNNVWASEDTYPERSDRLLLLGPTYNLVREGFFRIDASKKRGARPRNLLITMGGEDPDNVSLWVLNAVIDLNTGLEITVVVGPAHSDKESIVLAGERGNRINVVVHSDMMREIAAADIAITGGGTTCYELAAAQVPALAIILEAHQSEIVNAMEQKGCVTVLGRPDELDVDYFQDELTRVLNTPSVLQSLGAAASEVFVAPGAPILSSTILEYASRTGPAYDNKPVRDMER